MKEKNPSEKKLKQTPVKVEATEIQVQAIGQKVMKKYNKAIKALAFR